MVAIAIVVAAIGAGCERGGDAGGATDKPSVVASFYPLAAAAERVAGDSARVANLTPPGAEPHDVEVTADQVDAIEDAEVVLYLGGGFQPAVEELAQRRGDEATDVLAAVDADTSDGDGDGDPHIWLDPRLYSEVVSVVADALIAAVPARRATFEENARDLQRELAALDEELAGTLSTCERREFVTTHDAFGHLATRYDLVQVPIAGLSPESEPSPARLADLAEQIRDRGITTVFSETLMAPDVARTLAREAGVGTDVLNPLEGLTDREADAGDDYFTIMRKNVAALAKALGCS